MALFRPTFSLLAGIVFALWSSPGRADPVVDRYTGICDASAAVALDDDHFVVAEDEHDVLVVYRLGRPSPLATIDLTDFLGNRRPGKKPKEGDIEGAARIGDRIYWITSHGRDKHGDLEPTRYRFFVTKVVAGADPPTVAQDGAPYKTTLDDLLRSLAEPGSDGAGSPPLRLAEAAERAPEAPAIPDAPDRPGKPAGLNIEGLAATADGSLLIGFRNPLPGDRALVVPLSNPSTVVEAREPARFGSPKLIDLGKRGIRSLERVGQEFIIVAGPFADKHPGPGGDFALYRWRGPESKEEPTPIPVDLGTLRPEAAFQVGNPRRLYLLSDDGDEPIDGNTCKDKETPKSKKFFRGMMVDLP